MSKDHAIHQALAHHQAGRTEEAEKAYRHLLQREPNNINALNLLGVLAQETERPAQAVELIERALTLRPQFAEAHGNLANALRDLGQLDRAMQHYQQAIRLKPDHAEAHNNMGLALTSLAKFEEAQRAFEHAIQLRPDYAQARWHLALNHLVQGDFENGWPLYEWRWRKKGAVVRQFAQPMWDRSPLDGKTILLHAEQGFGDTIQFVRYAKHVADRGGRVVLECQKTLAELLERMAGVAQIVEAGAALPLFDLHCPLMSLPRILKTTLETIPAPQDYISPDPQRVAQWEQKLSLHGPSPLRVGLAWAGSPTNTNDRNRSIRLAQLAPLFQVPGVQFISLQKRDAAKQIADVPANSKLIDFTSDLHNFADTAALIANLHLVISVDTVVVHLAGAMGKPVWAMIPVVPDWRWMLNRSDSPWYPTLRLYRQTRLADWEPVIQAVVSDLTSAAL